MGHLILWHSIPNAVFFIDNLYAQQHNMMQHQLFFIFQRIFKMYTMVRNWTIWKILLQWLWYFEFDALYSTLTLLYILRCPIPLNRTRCLSKHMSPLMWIEIPWCLGVEGGGGPYLCDLSVWHSPVVSLPQCPGGWVWPPYSGEHWHTGCGPWLPPNEVEFC